MKLRTIESRLRPTDTRVLKPPPKHADPYYQTPEHRAWAAEIIRRAGGQCQDPKHDPKRSRFASRLFADHVKERGDGGAPLDLSNGLARCGSCHTRKTIFERTKRLRRGS